MGDKMLISEAIEIKEKFETWRKVEIEWKNGRKETVTPEKAMEIARKKKKEIKVFSPGK
jgi:hypothetical protein